MYGRSGRVMWVSTLWGLALLTLCCWSTAAFAQAGDRIVKSISRPEMKDLMEREGYAVSLDEDGDIVWKLEGYRCYMFVDKDEESVQFHSSFSDGNATLKKVNTWNRTKRFSRSYLDDDGDPHLELDLSLTGGVTEAAIKDYLMTCRISFTTWIKEVVE